MNLIPRIVGVPALILLATCTDPVGVTMVERRLEALDARPVAFRFQGAWGLLVEGLLAEGESGLDQNMRIPLHVSTTGGDEESLALRPAICTSESGGPYLCGQFLFSMEPGRHVSELRQYVDRLHGALSFVGVDGSWASVWLFEGDADRGMAMVRRWPGVRSASYNGLAFNAGGTQPSLDRPVVNVSPLSFTPPVRGDGIVQVRSGDLVTVTYSPAVGGERSASFTMCEPPSGDTGTAIVGLGEDPGCG